MDDVTGRIRHMRLQDGALPPSYTNPTKLPTYKPIIYPDPDDDGEDDDDAISAQPPPYSVVCPQNYHVTSGRAEQTSQASQTSVRYPASTSVSQSGVFTSPSRAGTVMYRGTDERSRQYASDLPNPAHMYPQQNSVQSSPYRYQPSEAGVHAGYRSARPLADGTANQEQVRYSMNQSPVATSNQQSEFTNDRYSTNPRLATYQNVNVYNYPTAPQPQYSTAPVAARAQYRPPTVAPYSQSTAGRQPLSGAQYAQSPQYAQRMTYASHAPRPIHAERPMSPRGATGYRPPRPEGAISPEPMPATLTRTLPAGKSPTRQPANQNQALKEAEVDALTTLLLRNMEASKDPTFYGMCVKCGQMIVGEETGCTALDQVYHLTCFICTQCGQSLKGLPFFAIETRPFCEQCYIHTLEKCSVCSHPITDRILRATGKPYHPQCFTCVVCGKSLDGIPFTVDATNQIHCIDDFHRKFAPRCSMCHHPIMPEPGMEETVRVVAMDRSFHVGCYKCEDCGLVLSSESDGRGCYPLDDHLLCKACNAKRIQALTSNMATEL